MKTVYRLSFFVLFFLISYQSSSSTMILKFQTYDSNTSKLIKPDSIVIRNLTKNMQKTITADSADFDSIFTGVDDNQLSTNLVFANTNYPNPFYNTTNFQINKSVASEVNFVLYDLLGNTILSKSFFLSAGTHNFRLNTDGIERGSYFLKISDINNQNLIKLVKLENRAGAVVSLDYEGFSNSYLINGQNSKTKIFLENSDFYSFTFYAGRYKTATIDSCSISAKKTNDTISIKLESIYKFDVNSGTVDVGGFDCNYLQSFSGSESSTYTNAYSFQSIIQNYSNFPYSDDVMRNMNFKFLTCPPNSNDSLTVAFCSRYQSWNSDNKDTKSITTQIYFNKDSNIIDSLKMVVYDWHFYTYQFPRYEEGYNYAYLTLTNLPFTINNQNVIKVDIIGKYVKNYLINIYRTSNTVHDRGHDDTYSGESHTLSMGTISDSAYIKLVLSP